MSDNFGKWFIFAGLGLILLGVIIWAASKIGLPFGKLPGDFSYKSDKTSVYFPLASSLIISVILTILINFILWLMKK